MLHYIHPEHIVGDVHPFFHDGRWFVYYLAPGFHSRLMTTDDLIHWTQVPITHEGMDSRDRDLAPYFVLGVFRDEINLVFRTYHGWTAGNMHSHVSDNLIDWRFTPDSDRILAQYMRYSSQRDPYVFWNQAEQQYWCVMTCKVKGLDDAVNGAVGFASSPDLKRWQGRGDLLFTGNMREPEVPQVFNIADKWYLLASIHTGDEVGKPSYWISDAPTGRWTQPTTDSLDGEHLQAANVGFDGSRWLLMGWIPLTTLKTHGRYTWGGHLAFPREVYPLTNGELGVRLESSFAAAIRGELLFDSTRQAVTAVSGTWTTQDGLTYLDQAGEGIADIGESFERVDIDLDLTLIGHLGLVGVRFDGRYEAGIDLKQHRLFIGSLSSAPLLYASLPISLGVGRCHMRIVFEDDMVEMFINDRYALAARLPRALTTTSIQLVASQGEARFHSIRIYHLHSIDELG